MKIIDITFQIVSLILICS